MRECFVRHYGTSDEISPNAPSLMDWADSNDDPGGQQSLPFLWSSRVIGMSWCINDNPFVKSLYHPGEKGSQAETGNLKLRQSSFRALPPRKFILPIGWKKSFSSLSSTFTFYLLVFPFFVIRHSFDQTPRIEYSFDTLHNSIRLPDLKHRTPPF